MPTSSDVQPQKLLSTRKIPMPSNRDQRSVTSEPAKPSSNTRRRLTRIAEPFTFARSSIASEEHPERNEDRVIADRSRGLVAVFDGVGGIPGGEIASQIAAHSIHAQWKHLIRCQSKTQQALQPEGQGTQGARLFVDDAAIDIPELLRGLIEEAHAHVRHEGAHQVMDRYSGLAEALTPKTTVALVALCQTSQSPGYGVVYAWVGDSRVYLLPDQQALTRLTLDDGLLAELVNRGLLDENSARRVDQATEPWHLTRQERLFFEKRNGITQAVGDELTPVVHVKRTTIAPGDRLLLCTDGIHDNLTDKELEDLLAHGARTTVARRIVRAAATRSRQDIVENMRAKPDDLSAVVVTCHH
ncbi:MAG: PP2C family protein-serine/threonine phosphatase [Ktedonobacterales bacterium]